MADKFKIVTVEAFGLGGGAVPTPVEDAWKDSLIEKEHTPAKIKTEHTCRGVENQIASIDSRIVDLEAQKSDLEAQFASMEALVNPSD